MTFILRPRWQKEDPAITCVSKYQDIRRYAIGINDRLYDVPKEVYDEINRLREEALKNV